MKTFIKSTIFKFFGFPVVALLLLINITDVKELHAEAFKSGSYIISMGEQPQTYNNGLMPFGLLFDLVIKDEVPVFWIIKPGKQLFDYDFNTTTTNANGVTAVRAYSAGSFVIPQVYLTADVLADIAYWRSQGVVVDEASVDFDATAYNYISSFPNAIIDTQNVQLVTDLFYQYTHNADDSQGIPSTYYSTGTPNQITSCSDVYALPHADPQDWDQATIDVYKSFVQNAKGFLWQGCHSVGAVEAHQNIVKGINFLNMNILTTNGQIAWKNDPDYAFSNVNSPDFMHEYTAGDNPIMQIASKVSSPSEAAQTDGSQMIYIPRPDSAWRDTTTVAVWDATNVNNGLNGNSTNKAALIAFGRAYGDPTNGMVVQQASHTDRTGTEAENVSAARFYGNLLLQASIEKRPNITIDTTSSLIYGNDYDMNATITGGTPPYDVNWTMSCAGITDPGTFTPANDSNVSQSSLVVFTPNNYTFDGCILRVRVTDSCNRKNIQTKIMAISEYHPPLGYANITHANEDFSTTGGLDVLETAHQVNALYTQVSGQDFNVTYVSLDADKQTPIPITGNIILELISTDGVTDLDPLSCKNAHPYLDMTDQIQLDQGSHAHFPSSGTNTLTITHLKSPTAYNDVAFRISYYGIQATVNSQYNYGIPNSKTPADIQTEYPMCSSECGTLGDSTQGPNNSITNWSCYKCIASYYGDTYCSRDNFSIRPAGFALDLNETGALIGGRTYQLDSNATTSAYTVDAGYTETLALPLDLNISDKLVVPAGCPLVPPPSSLINDINYTNGIGTPVTYSYNNIGDINISITDMNWTSVDIDKTSLAGVYSDCIKGSSTNTPDVNGKVGCHTSGVKKFTFVPLTFRTTLTLEDNNLNKFTYIANQNPEQAAKIKLAITAVIDDATPNTNLDNGIATNYIGSCFAKDINSTITLNTNKTLNWQDSQLRIWMYDKNTTTYQNTNPASFIHSKMFFIPGTPGKAEPEVLVNFERNVTVADNPFKILRNDFNITLIESDPTTPVANLVKADDFDRTAIPDSNATFLYTRAHVPRQRIIGNSAPVDIFSEVFCNSGALTSCDKTFLPNGITSVSSDDPRWFKNLKHNSTIDGNVTSVTQKNSLNLVTSTAITFPANNISRAVLTYDASKGYPYKTTMDINASSWLIYNKYNAGALVNEFEVEFVDGNGTWAGSSENSNTTGSANTSSKTNRRVMW
ncbi:hypothetical protein [Sulfurimonas sp.]